MGITMVVLVSITSTSFCAPSGVVKTTLVLKTRRTPPWGSAMCPAALLLSFPRSAILTADEIAYLSRVSLGGILISISPDLC